MDEWNVFFPLSFFLFFLAGGAGAWIVPLYLDFVYTTPDSFPYSVGKTIPDRPSVYIGALCQCINA